MQLTAKQKQAIQEYNKYNPRITFFDGAKRAGKTFVNNLLFLHHVGNFRNERKHFIIAGATTGSIWRNVLLDWEVLLDKEIKIHQDGSFDLYGNKVFIFGGEKSDSWKKIRGMTSNGTYFNEMTALNETFTQEAFSRTSGTGARIFVDTNTDKPSSYVKKNYIDKSGTYLSNGQMNIYRLNWQLDDNTALDPIYVQSIKESTATGSAYDRDILGKWVASEGIVYKDFSESENVCNEIPEIQYYLIGVDWGYEHYGVVAVLGYGVDEKYYLIEYIAKQRELVSDYWKLEIKKLSDKYKPKSIYCDTARADHINELRKLGVNAKNANKSVKEGNDYIGSLYKQRKLMIPKHLLNGRYYEEIYSYVFGNNDEPKKEYDDVMDTIRYALFSDKTNIQATYTIDSMQDYF